MLSTIQPSHPSMPKPYSQSSAMSTMTASLPIIPPPRQQPARPKLSINTEQPRILGKGASLRLDTLSAASPTVRNTYTNAYERPSTAPTLQRPQRPSLSIESDLPAAANNSASTPSSASTLSSALTSASADSATSALPYKQPHNLVSILSNSPARSIVPRKMASSRPMFPAEKHVCFRTPLEEEITTTRYTMAHSDLESSVSTLSTISSVASSTDSDVSAAHHSLIVNTSNTSSTTSISPLQLSLQKSTSTFASAESSPRSKGPRAGDKRDSSSSEDESDSCPQTPIAGRRKRTRDWRWTLGPLPSSDKSSSSSASEATTSDDSS
ncbi:hypothetical protein BM1_05997 [Bipolaris maydis]|nr:hypothetical protein BM1_05997 [Bipolaris maydis]